jgi:hypothetical protein
VFLCDATRPVKFVVEALRRLDWTCTQVGDWTVCTYVRICGWCLVTGARCPRDWSRLFVVTGARCPLTKSVLNAVELQATTEPHYSRGVQPGGIYVYVVQREPTPGGPGSGLRWGRRRCLVLCQLPLIPQKRRRRGNPFFDRLWRIEDEGLHCATEGLGVILATRPAWLAINAKSSVANATAAWHEVTPACRQWGAGAVKRKRLSMEKVRDC